MSLLLVAALAAGGCGSLVTGGDGGDGGSGGGGFSTTTGIPTTGSSTSNGVTKGALGDCIYESGAGSTGSTAVCNGFYDCDAGAVKVICADEGDNTYCNCFLDQQLVGSCSPGADCVFPGSCCKALLDGDVDPEPRSFGACSTEASTGSGTSGNINCHHAIQCVGGDASIECNGPPGGPAVCECRDGAYTLLGTCDQPDVDCGYEGSCCWSILNP